MDEGVGGGEHGGDLGGVALGEQTEAEGAAGGGVELVAAEWEGGFEGAGAVGLVGWLVEGGAAGGGDDGVDFGAQVVGGEGIGGEGFEGGAGGDDGVDVLDG